ncbi:DUF3180 domain-containing protein [Glaciibacter psychrotolerans]|uniref:F0F1-type ATP synthase assembly protein I n=1 Tax=Glaciibacter psychrotolerans TaxID=670054 RepID=A0A7Z0EGV8_9MICO|nr:DUF3180 domain-containing protein [Leifsonia psychrotolerans]NYJ21432.1 F0F1-type ATP synthase assembly protein I [Leifsonia psychrotolerans]
MKRSHPTPLIALGLLGLVVGYLLEVAAAATGNPNIVPPLSLPITLVAVAVVLLLLAWPVRQSTRTRQVGEARRQVNPFVAMRVAVLAKASSFAGALLFGAGLGIGLHLVTRTVVPPATTVWLAIGMALGAAILLAGGLVAEYFCMLPPSDDERQESGASRG